MDGRQRTTAALALLGALVATLVLHTSGHRPDVARIVPVVVVWGGLVFTLGSRAPGLRHVLIAAALVRVVVVGCPAGLSDDVYRYLWEGHALLAGFDPLYTSPAEVMAQAPDLAPSVGARVNHPELPSVYPPLAMGWFVVLVLAGGTAGTAQLLTATADLVTVWAVHRMDARGGWLYALLPLPVLEAAAGAHIDVPAVAWTALGVLALQRARATLGGALLVAGVLTKLFPLVVLPTAWRQLTGWRRAVVPPLTLGAALLVSLPFLRAELPAGVVAYGTRWSFNGLLHVPLQALVGPLARPLLAVLGLGAAIFVVWRARSALAAWAWMGLVFVAATPTLHPWYLLWALVPSLALGRREVAAASVFVPVSYAVLATLDPVTGTWDAGPWLWASTWGPALGAAAVVAWWDRGRMAAPREAP